LADRRPFLHSRPISEVAIAIAATQTVAIVTGGTKAAKGAKIVVAFAAARRADFPEVDLPVDFLAGAVDLIPAVSSTDWIETAMGCWTLMKWKARPGS